MIVRPWDFDIDVDFELEEGDRSTGVQPYCVILSAKVGGVDVYEMLNNDQIERLEAAVMRACDL